MILVISNNLILFNIMLNFFLKKHALGQTIYPQKHIFSHDSKNLFNIFQSNNLLSLPSAQFTIVYLHTWRDFSIYGIKTVL